MEDLADQSRLPVSSPTQEGSSSRHTEHTPIMRAMCQDILQSPFTVAPPPLFPLHFGYFLWAFKLNSWSRSPWQHVLGDTSTSIYCLQPLDTTYTDANPILSRS